MGESYQQTDVATACGVIGVSGLPSSLVNFARQMEGGSPTPGSADMSATLDKNSTSIPFAFETLFGTPNITLWPSGDWVVRLEIVIGSNKVTWEDTYICKISDSGCIAVVIGSITGQGIATALLGVIGPMTVTIASDTTVLATDRIYIACAFKNNHRGGNKTIGVKPSQIIDTPIPTSGGGVSLTLAAPAGTGVAGAVTVEADRELQLAAPQGTGVAGAVTVEGAVELTLAAPSGTGVAGPVEVEAGVLELSAPSGTGVAGPVTVGGGTSVFSVWNGVEFVIVGGTQ